MSKQKEILDILSLYESILETKPINEVSNASNELFGGGNVSIPADGAHGNQSGWQSQNAWDIKAAIGTPVYAVIGGTLKTYADYGPKPIHRDGKTLFGAGFTVNSDNGLPDVYYTHLKDVTVRQGDKIECGQLLGYVMDFPGSDYDHLHIGVERGNVRQFLNPDGTLKCANGQTISGTTVTGSGSETENASGTEDASEKAYNDASGASSSSTGSFWDTGSSKDTFMQKSIKSIADKFLSGGQGVKEQKDFEEEILKIYEEIKSTKKSISKIIDIQETALISPLDSTSVNSGFGARWGGTHNGVDLAANAANVKSPADGVVVKVAADEPPCGGTIIIDHANGYRTGFCHMQKINVSAGQQIKQGDIIGVSGGGANDPGHGRSDGRHLHFTLRKDGNLVDPMDYIGKDGIKLTGEPPKSSSSDSSSSSTTDASSEKAYNDASGASNSSTGSFWDTGSSKDTFMLQSVKSIADKFLSGGKGLKEQKDFGNDITNRYGRIIIPKDTNSRIKSPVSGVVDNSRYASGCVNQIIISTKSNRYLQFCGISKPSVGNGQSISRGTLLGITDTDVEVTMFDSSWNTVPIESNHSSSSFDKDDDEKDKKRKEKIEKSYEDPLLAMVAHLPAKMIDKVFGDRYDEKTGKMTQKRWGGVADKRQVDPWLLDFAKNPFKSKKVNEDIERIKKLL